MEDHRTPKDRIDLRREAEDRIGEDEINNTREMSDADVLALLHELKVHQVELEMQNDELKLAQAETERALHKYSDLYNFAPVGYLTVDENDVVVEANETAAAMLGVPNSQLKGFLFGFFVIPENRFDFVALCQKLESYGGKSSGEIQLLRRGKEPFYALVDVVGDSEPKKQCRITITDITARKEAEIELQKAYEELERRVEERTRDLARSQSEAERRTAEVESFIASMADGVILFDAQGDVTFINDVGMDILGVPLGGSFDRWFERFPLNDLDGNPVSAEERAISRALNGETVTDMRGTLILPWNKSVTLSMSASPVLNGEGEVIGATVVFRDQSDRVALEKERQTLLERERHIAEILERAVIPHGEYNVPGIKVAVRYEPALDEAGVGGDFYDVFELDNGKVGVLIGDVAGKGLAAAVGIAAIRYSIRSYAYLDPRPSRVLTLANKALCKSHNEEINGMFTAYFAVIDISLGGITYSGGGHEPALLKTAAGRIERLETRGPLLGILGDIEYTEHSRKLMPGDKIIMVTDGITEARPNPESLFTIEGVERYLAESPEEDLDAIADGILRTAKNHAGGYFKDDAAIVVVSLLSED